MSFSPYGATHQQPIRHHSATEARIHRRSARAVVAMLRIEAQAAKR